MPKKPIFGVFLRKFYGHALRPPQCHAYIFCQMKGLMKIHNRAKFQLRSICGSQVINFQMFSVMEYNAKYDICYGFSFSNENSK